MQIKIKQPDALFPFFSAIAIACLSFLIFCYIKQGSPFAWIPQEDIGAASSFMVKFFFLFIIFFTFRPLYSHVKYRWWAWHQGIRIPTKIDFTPSHFVVHYKKSMEQFDYQSLRLRLVLRISQIALASTRRARHRNLPRVTLLTLQFSNAEDDCTLFEIDHAVTYFASTPMIYFSPDEEHIQLPRSATQDLDTILTFANRFADFSYDFVYDCKMIGFVSNKPNSIFRSSEPYAPAQQYASLLQNKIEETLSKNQLGLTDH